MTKIELELIPDPEMYIFFGKSSRSGILCISNRYSKANNKNLKFYGPRQESKGMRNLDANNLYGYAMSKFLPSSGFKGIDHKEFDLNKYSSNNSKGCFLEVDFECRK